ncbi:hypothetical protein QBC38DRAFT_69258 [Podospora fimiseda]|uniref:Secreted protein n=1 Tax=Podospora fimiseda TaxID=252190 RepID=A0AAN7BUM9_9PEZI|nr:hypothetical protein QBC38DRAFT_69258 [Podospora fimiseda]
MGRIPKPNPSSWPLFLFLFLFHRFFNYTKGEKTDEIITRGRSIWPECPVLSTWLWHVSPPPASFVTLCQKYTNLQKSSSFFAGIGAFSPLPSPLSSFPRKFFPVFSLSPCGWEIVIGHICTVSCLLSPHHAYSVIRLRSLVVCILFVFHYQSTGRPPLSCHPPNMV